MTHSSDYGLQQVTKTLHNWPVVGFSTTALKFLAIGLEFFGRTRLTTLTEIIGISDNETSLYQGPSIHTEEQFIRLHYPLKWDNIFTYFWVDLCWHCVKSMASFQCCSIQ